MREVGYCWREWLFLALALAVVAAGASAVGALADAGRDVLRAGAALRAML